MRRAIVAALAALALLAACDDGDDGGLVFKDPKGGVEVERWMTFSLEFRVNASVGFDWEQVAAPREGALLEPKGTKVDYPNPESIGDSGTKRFSYEATEPGSQTLVFRRLYRGDEDERRRITVRVRD
jgi:predicted secreted protein